MSLTHLDSDLLQRSLSKQQSVFIKSHSVNVLLLYFLNHFKQIGEEVLTSRFNCDATPIVSITVSISINKREDTNKDVLGAFIDTLICY